MSLGRLARRLLAPVRRLQMGWRGDAAAARHRPVAGGPPPGPGAGGTVVLDIRDRPLDRDHYLLGRTLFAGGFSVHLRVRSEAMGRADGYGRELLGLPGLTVETTRRGRPADPPPTDPAQTVWVSEDPSTDVPERPWRAVMRLDYDWYSAPPGGLTALFTMHPVQYRPAVPGREGTRPIDDLTGLRATERTAGVLFAGAVDPALYAAGGPITERYGLLPRATILARLDAGPHAPLRLPPPPNDGPTAAGDDGPTAAGRAGGGAFRAALARFGGDARRRFVRTDGWRIDAEDWLPTLAQADFFLTAPGFKIPHAHNVVEALAVGAVPIINYAHLMRPPLTDREALLFRTEDELTERVGEALAMPPEERRRMARAAAAYYDAHLTPEAFAKTFLRAADAAGPDPITLYLNAE
ncbi:glycosyltransferase family protein [Alienimonas californiensis]|uniref:Spore protein YkvP/CgeB glycosyl transferase-like domain-containing protein n=1 Tax=Alienimonas californiensis TaxID=2527989 RepID=A0A517P6C0_9PLAN|nr:glycosyltransferase [Alienimonas californiensis]QDT14912.1 hypothetical protein CA12_09920 [Alienimonas californiensis]